MAEIHFIPDIHCMEYTSFKSMTGNDSFIRYRTHARQCGFTLIELLVVVAVMGLLAALLLPAINSSIDKGKTSKCISNLRQLGSATILYAGDHGGKLPNICDVDYSKAFSAAASNAWWPSLLVPYVKKAGTSNTDDFWRCPSMPPSDVTTNTGARTLNYGYGPVKPLYIDFISANNPQGSLSIAAISRASSLWMFGDIGKPKGSKPSDGYTGAASFERPGNSGWGTANQPAARHGRYQSVNFVHVDGHVESWKWDDLRNQKNNVFGWDPVKKQIDI